MFSTNLYSLMKARLLDMLKVCDWSYCTIESGYLESLLYDSDTHRYVITCSDYSLNVQVVNRETMRCDFRLDAGLSLIFNKTNRLLYAKATRKIAKLRKRACPVRQPAAALHLDTK